MTSITINFVRALVDTDSSVPETLLKQRNFHINGMIKNKMPVLHFAVIFRLVDAVKVMLKHGANVNLKDKGGNTCLYLALQTSVWSDDIKRVRRLLKDVVLDLDSACKEKLTAPFSSDAENQQRVQQFFEQRFEKDEEHVDYADFIDNTSLIELPLSSGANPNHGNSCSTPLLEYCAHGCQDIRVLNLLLQYGADVNITDIFGSTALGLAAENGTVEMVEKLLDADADVNELNIGELPLSIVASRKWGNEVIVSIMKLLISRGADVNALDHEGCTPLYAAVRKGSLEIVEYLLKLGANPNYYKVIYEDSGSPLYTSIRRAEVEITECLINYGADVFYKRLNRFSLLKIAMLKPVNSQNFDFGVALQLVTLLMERGVTIGEHDYTSLIPEKIELLEKCQRQLQTLKETKIYPDYPTTYFDFLLKRDKQLVRCLRDENIATAMKSEDYKKKFVYFAHRLEANYDRGLKHLAMIDGLRSILSDVFKGVFPEELIFMISDYFSLEDLGKCFKDQFNA